MFVVFVVFCLFGIEINEVEVDEVEINEVEVDEAEIDEVELMRLMRLN